MCKSCGTPLLSSTEKSRGRHEDCPALYDEVLFERLRTWRRERAEQQKVPAFVVFSDATLETIAERKPDSPQALLSVSGVGRAKLEAYGDDVLTIVVGS